MKHLVISVSSRLILQLSSVLSLTLWVTPCPNRSGPTLVATHLNEATTHTEGRISDQLQSGCVRELLQFHWDLRSVMIVGRSLQKYLQLFHLYLKVNQRVKSTSMPPHHWHQLTNVWGKIGETPVSQHKLQQTKYSKQKVKKITKAMKRVMVHDFQSDETDDEGEMIKQLKEKFQKSTKRSEEVQVLTVLPKSWPIRKIQSQFGASNYMARKAKHLVREKGILATPNPKPGHSLSKNHWSCLWFLHVWWCKQKDAWEERFYFRKTRRTTCTSPERISSEQLKGSIPTF